MGRREFRVTITFAIEAEDEVDFTVDVAEATQQSAVATSPTAVPDAVVVMIEDNAPSDSRSFQWLYVERCQAELDVEARLPKTATGRTYLNFHPPRRYGAKRAAGLETRSGRVEIYCPPRLATDVTFAEPVLNNGEPIDAVKLYLKSEAAVDEAVRLTRVGVEARR